MEFLLNERSLHGQFDNIEEFLTSLRPVVKCMELIRDYSDMRIYKIQNFYECRITTKEKICDLKKHSVSDELMRFQLSLDNEIYEEPHWDKDPIHDVSDVFTWEGEDVTATSLAEAAVTENSLLSFESDKFKDCVLLIENMEREYRVNSIYTPKYLLEQCEKNIEIDRRNMLSVRYDETRIDCSTLEEKYGVDFLEKHEFEMLVSSLDKFVQHHSWEDIDRDDGLQYKKYNPNSSKDNWFKGAKYKGRTIMKFRFSDVLRCYGYRKNDKFRILRLERDHTISDKG